MRRSAESVGDVQGEVEAEAPAPPAEEASAESAPPVERSLHISARSASWLQARPDDASSLEELPGDHLSPASGGLRRQLLGEWADDPSRQRAIERVAEISDGWSRLQARQQR